MLNRSLPNKMTTAVGAALALSFLSPANHALELEEVVVVAQKREQSAQDVGITLTAFNGSALEEMGLTSSNEIASIVPNVNIHSPAGEGGVAVVFVRGVGLNDFATNNTGPVGVYVDEVYAGSSNAQVTTLMDVERVEVLKGPQGTLFGKNTTGGAINIISRKPTDEFEAYVRTGYGSYSEGNDEYKIEGAASGPLSDNLRARASVVQYSSDGYMKNLETGDYAEKDVLSGRVLLDWDASEDLNILFNVHGSDNDSDADWYNGSLDKDFYEGRSDIEPVLKVEQYGGSITLDYALTDSINLISITAYDELDKEQLEDADMSADSLIELNFNVDSETWSQELRLVGSAENTEWITGFYYWNDDLEQDQGAKIYDGLIDSDYFNTQETETWAVFGQLEYSLTEALVLTGGLRYTDVEVDFTGSGDTNYFFIDPDGGFVQSYDLKESVDDSAVSGKLGLNWHSSDEVMWYGTVSKGFKGIGINGNFLVDLGARMDYDSEDLMAYEIGVKSSLFDGAMQLNGAAFYYDYADAQIFNTASVPVLGLPANTIRNGDISMYGADLDLVWSPVSALYIQAGLGYLNSEYDENILDPTTGLLEIKGNRVQNSPEWSAFALINYEWELGDAGYLAAQLDATYSDDVYYSTFEDDAIGQDAYTISNARLTYRTASENMEVALWARNLSDKEYRTYSFDLRSDFGIVQYMRGVPRTVGVDVLFRFE